MDEIDQFPKYPVYNSEGVYMSVPEAFIHGYILDFPENTNISDEELAVLLFNSAFSLDYLENERIKNGEEPFTSTSKFRAYFDSPFYNGAGTQLGNPKFVTNNSEGSANVNVCFSVIGCGSRSDANYLLQGLYGAKVGENIIFTKAINLIWKVTHYPRSFNSWFSSFRSGATEIGFYFYKFWKNSTLE